MVKYAPKREKKKSKRKKKERKGEELPPLTNSVNDDSKGGENAKGRENEKK